MDALGKIKSVMHVLNQRADRSVPGLPKDQQLWLRLRDVVQELGGQPVEAPAEAPAEAPMEARDPEIEEIKRLAGMLKEQEFGLGSDEGHVQKAQRLIAVADQAITSGNEGQARAILRELLKLIQAHEASETGEGDFETLDKSLGLQQGY